MPRRPRSVVISRRAMLTGLAVGGGAAAGYIVSGALDQSLEDARAFLEEDNPEPVPYLPPDGAVDVLPPRREFYSDPARSESQTFGELFLPASANPALSVVVLVHGGGWREDLGHRQMENPARDLASFDLAVWNVEYRRVGSGGGWPTTVVDVCDAVDHLEVLSRSMAGRLDLSRVVVIGHSAGGQLALYVAGRTAIPDTLPGARPRVPVCGAVSLAGPADLARAHAAGDRYLAGLLGGTPDQKPQRYQDASPINHLPTRIPVLCSHGTDDKVVLPEQSEEYVRVARGAGDPARLDLVPGAGHDPWSDIKGEPWKRVRTAVLEMLGRRPTESSAVRAPAAGAPHPANAPHPAAASPTAGPGRR